MRKDKEVLLAFEFAIDLHHILIHLRADPFAGGEEIFHDICFPFHILIGNLFAILAGKTERLHVVQYWQLRIAKIR